MSTVIALHSSGMSGRQWRSLGERLAGEHRVLTPDFIGSGSNPPWPADQPFHFRQDVEELKKLIAAQSERVHLVGHSYGGFLTLQLLLDDATRARVRSIAVYEPVAFGVLHPRADAELPFDDATGGDEAWLRTFVEWWNGKGAWDGLPPQSREQFLRVGRKVYFEVKSLALDETPAAAYPPFKGRALILDGAKPPEPARLRLKQGGVKATGLQVESVALYNGGGTWLYGYKGHTDGRLVAAPEAQMAAFGGDPDNFVYPRHDLDFSLFRVYEDGKPYKPAAFLPFAAAGAKVGEPVFISGHPGPPARQETLAQEA